MTKRFTVKKACRILSFFNHNRIMRLGQFYIDQIGFFPDLEAELVALDRVFTNKYGFLNYRNLEDMVILACTMRLSAVIMKSKPVRHRSMSNWNRKRGRLHHDADLTPLVASQFPLAKEDEFHFSKDYYDLVVGNTAVEVGDCRVSKILEALEEGMNLWVLPEPFDTIYVFNRGRNWRSFERIENYMLEMLRDALKEARMGSELWKFILTP